MTQMPQTDAFIREIQKHSDSAKAAHHVRFFKCFEGGYGDLGDKFCGVSSPDIQSAAKKFYKILSLKQIEQLLQNPLHEARAGALFMLTLIFDKATIKDRESIVRLYLQNSAHINNWDLVDISVHKILGRFCAQKGDYSLLYRLSESPNLWEQRMAVVANWHIIKTKEYKPILGISQKFLTHRHDLIHKATGWMLREMGKSSKEGADLLLDFLERNADKMPRTMLRYSIERLSLEQKKYFMSKGK